MKALSITKHFSQHRLIFRRALRTAITMFFAVILYRQFSLTQGFWVPLSIAIVMQTTIGATLRKGIQRFLGTIIGIILGSLLVTHIHNPYWIDGLLIAFLFITYYMKAFNLVNYGIFVVPLTIMVVFLVSAVVPQEAHRLIWARLYDTTLGALIGVAGSLLLFPDKNQTLVEKNLAQTLDRQAAYFNSIMQSFLSADNKELQQKRREFENCLATNRLLYAEQIYEWRIKRQWQQQKNHLRLLQAIEKTGQFLLALEVLAQQKISPEIQIHLSSLLDHTDVLANHEILETRLNAISKSAHTEHDKHFLISLHADLHGYWQCLKKLQQLNQTT